MGKRDELIAKYADDLKNKCKMTPNMDLLSKVVIGCGPAIYSADSETVAASQSSEIQLVKNNFLVKKLGLKDGPELTAAINAVIETYGKSERNKYRAVVISRDQGPGWPRPFKVTYGAGVRRGGKGSRPDGRGPFSFQKRFRIPPIMVQPTMALTLSITVNFALRMAKA
jgi:hypothetical protein